jgi:hypothetical protein
MGDTEGRRMNRAERRRAEAAFKHAEKTTMDLSDAVFRLVEDLNYQGRMIVAWMMLLYSLSPDSEADFELSLKVCLEAVRLYHRKLSPMFKASDDYPWEEPPRDDKETEAVTRRVFRLLRGQYKGATVMTAAYVLGEALVMADEPEILDHELAMFADKLRRDYYIELGRREREALN